MNFLKKIWTKAKDVFLYPIRALFKSGKEEIARREKVKEEHAQLEKIKEFPQVKKPGFEYYKYDAKRLNLKIADEVREHKKIRPNGSVFINFSKMGKKIEDLEGYVLQNQEWIIESLGKRKGIYVPFDLPIDQLAKIAEDNKIVSTTTYDSKWKIEEILDYLMSLPWNGEMLLSTQFTIKIRWTQEIGKIERMTTHTTQNSSTIEEAWNDVQEYYWKIYEDAEILEILNVHILPDNEDVDYLASLRAFGTISDRSYHNNLLYSMVVDDDICIYWTYVQYHGIATTKKGSNMINLSMYVKSLLKENPAEVIEMVKKGEVHKFLGYVSKANNRNYLLFLYFTKVFYLYKPDGTCDMIEDENKLEPKEQCFTYCMNHVGLSEVAKILKNKRNPRTTKAENIKIQDPIRDSIGHDMKKQSIFHFYDIETFTSGEVGIICSVTYENGRFIDHSYANVDDFAQYVDSISYKNNKKTRPTSRIDYHSFYAHNASNFDALYIFRPLNKICRIKNFIDSGNSIKGFQYGTNIQFRDSLLMIQGTLANLAKEIYCVKIKASELPEGCNYFNYPDDHYIDSKEVFPYSFYTEENANYIGEVPDVKYFGHHYDDLKTKEKRHNQCVDDHLKGNRKFNMKEYVKYYCIIDCILGYKVLKEYETLNVTLPEIIVDPNEMRLIRDSLFKEYRYGTCRICSNKECTGICYDNNKKKLLYEHPVFKGISENDEYKIKITYLKYARSTIYFNPLQYHTTSSMTVNRFAKLYNKTELYSAPEKYKKHMKKSYSGGVTDVYKRHFVYENKDKIEEAHKMNDQSKFNEFMEAEIKKDCLRIHKEDINSSYPTEMTKLIPCKLVRAYGMDNKKLEDGTWFKSDKKLIDFLNLLLGKNVIYGSDHEYLEKLIIPTNLYHVSYKYKDRAFIPNLYTHKDDKFMGVQKNTGLYWGTEIKKALIEHINNKEEHHGASPKFTYFKVNGYFVFTAKKVFKEYIDEYYAKRLKYKKNIAMLAGIIPEDSDKIENMTLGRLKVLDKSCKDIMNCLYGKYGQAIFGDTHICNTAEYKILLKDTSNKITNVKVIPGGDDLKYDDVFIVSTTNFGKTLGAIGNLTYIASYITAAARCNLFEMIYEAGCKNVYYVDTDSCYYTGKRLSKINPAILGHRNSEIGENIEGNNVIITEAIFGAPKLYGATGFIKKGNNWVHIDEKVKSKGVKMGQIKFKNLQDLNSGIEEKITTPSFAFNRRMLDGKVIVSEGFKNTRFVLSKRVFKDNNSIMNE